MANFESKPTLLSLPRELLDNILCYTFQTENLEEFSFGVHHGPRLRDDINWHPETIPPSYPTRQTVDLSEFYTGYQNSSHEQRQVDLLPGLEPNFMPAVSNYKNSAIIPPRCDPPQETCPWDVEPLKTVISFRNVCREFRKLGGETLERQKLNARNMRNYGRYYKGPEAKYFTVYLSYPFGVNLWQTLFRDFIPRVNEVIVVGFHRNSTAVLDQFNEPTATEFVAYTRHPRFDKLSRGYASAFENLMQSILHKPELTRPNFWTNRNYRVVKETTIARVEHFKLAVVFDTPPPPPHPSCETFEVTEVGPPREDPLGDFTRTIQTQNQETDPATFQGPNVRYHDYQRPIRIDKLTVEPPQRAYPTMLCKAEKLLPHDRDPSLLGLPSSDVFTETSPLGILDRMVRFGRFSHGEMILSNYQVQGDQTAQEPNSRCHHRLEVLQIFGRRVRGSEYFSKRIQLQWAVKMNTETVANLLELAPLDYQRNRYASWNDPFEPHSSHDRRLKLSTEFPLHKLLRSRVEGEYHFG